MDLFGDLPPPTTADDEPLSNSTDATLKRHSADETDGTPVCKKAKESVPHLKGYWAARQGEREDMQDAHVIMDNVKLSLITTNYDHTLEHVAYYGVFDGHGGARASRFAADHLHTKIFSSLPKGRLERDVRKCLIESFKKIDEEFLSLASKSTPSWKDGSTAVVLVVLNDIIYSANVGDSRAYVCKRGKDQEIACVLLTKDHNPTNFEERKRIEKSGGIVRDGRVMGIVEVSRSIGDGRFKRCGVIPTPDVFKCQLTEDHLFLILACDGLWKVFTAQEAAECIINVLEDESVKLSKENSDTVATNYTSTDTPASDRDYKFEIACNKLAVEAVKRGCTDNVTVLIVDLYSKS